MIDSSLRLALAAFGCIFKRQELETTRDYRDYCVLSRYLTQEALDLVTHYQIKSTGYSTKA